MKSSLPVIYADGENVFFQLFDVLRRHKLVRYRDDLVKFNMHGLLTQAMGDKDFTVRYYGAKLQEVDTSNELLKRSKKMIDHKRRWIGYLVNQDIEYINGGQLVLRKNVNWRTRKDELVFEEKGIDVTLAVDLVESAVEQTIETAVIWSSDQDIKPAMLSAQNHGVKVVYLGRQDRTNDVLVGSADEVITITSEQIINAFKEVNE